MMRRLLFLLVFAVSMAFVSVNVAFAQMNTVPQASLDCVKVLLAQERAWNAGDMEGFLKGYKDSPDIVFIGRSVQHGFAPMAENYRKSYSNKATMGTLSFGDYDVKPLGENYAVVIGKYRLERKKQDGGNAGGIFSLVMEKTDDGWKIVVDHTTE